MTKPTVADIKRAVAEGFSQTEEDLSDLVGIASVSSDSFRQSLVEESAQAVALLYGMAGFSEIDILRAPNPDGSPGRPAVVAHRPGPAGAPSVMLYAHHDVQPAGDIKLWKSPPFQATVRGERMYGRGTADDKAGVVAHLAAVRAWGEQLPVNLTVFIEGEEEIGSPSFVNFLKTYRDRLAADVIVVADSSNWAIGVPAITTSLRGVATVEVTLTVAEHAVHSGMFGGPCLDAVTLLARLVSTLHDEDGAVAVAGLQRYDEHPVEYREENYRAEAAILDSVQLAGRGSLAARLWTRPALSVIGMDVTPVASSSNTLIPQARLALSLRVSPGQDTHEAAQALKEHLLSHAPFGARVEVEITECGPGFRAEGESPALKELRWALQTAWGHEAVDIGIGGSIPFISDLQQVFPEAEILVTGVEDPHAKAHAENESVHLGELRKAATAEALLLGRLGGVF